MTGMTQTSPTHGDPGDGILWTHVNVGEAIPGVVTPLTAAFWTQSQTGTPRQMYRELGVMKRAEMTEVFTPTNRPVQFLFGRIAANVDFLRLMGDRMPGTSGAALEEQMLGSVRPDAIVHQDRSRYPFVAIGFVKLLLTMPGRVHAVHERTLSRWRSVRDKAPAMSFEEARKAFLWECTKGPDDVIGTHGLTALLSPAVWEPLAAITRRIGTEDDVLALSAGLGAVEEADMMDALWQLAQTDAPFDSFLDRYGFMGPDSGELTARPWRLDARSLEAARASFADGRQTRPATKQAQASQTFTDTKVRLLSKAGPVQGALLRTAIWLCQTYLPLREVGKGAMIAHSDIARICADRMGECLASQALIASPADIYYLTPDELADPAAFDLADLIAARRAERTRYEALTVPDAYTAADIPAILATEGQDSPGAQSNSLSGLGVSRGTVEGLVRVIHGADDFADFAPGEILVCKTTDPGWAPVFTIAAAMVVDIGGMLSHSAIIARELGVPAVVNTRNGTRVLKTGQRIRVDGQSGAVEILDGSLADLTLDDQDDPGAIDPRTLPNQAPPPLVLPDTIKGLALLGEALDESLYGGKAASLARLIGAGLPVPPGIALSWEQVDALNIETLRAALPDFGGPVAVRSSGIGEDGADASFAGQHDTILGVEGTEAILDAVRTVGQSAHAAHVAHYRDRMGEAEAHPRIGIVVQQLVPSFISGVMFTHDPMGRGNHCVVEAAWGLGEVVVGSLVTPDHYEIEPGSGRILSSMAGDKSICMTRDGSHPVTRAAATALCLTERQAEALAQLAAQCEAVFNAPQDVEWAFAGTTLYLLQSRPITAR